MQNLLDNYFLQNPLRIAERTKLIVSLATALWNAQHDEPMNESALHLFLCDETCGDLTEEQKCFVRKCKAHVDRMYLRMLCKQEQENGRCAAPLSPPRAAVCDSSDKERRVRLFSWYGLCGPSWTVSEGRKKKQSAMVLSRGKLAFRVNRSVSEKGRSKPGLYGGHLKCVVGLSGIWQHRLVRLPIPENSENYSSHFPADMTNYIHVMQPFRHFLFIISAEHWITLDGNCGCQPDGATQIRRSAFGHAVLVARELARLFYRGIESRKGQKFIC